jgi:primosomal protein N' (replication factor Y) (superfamily II helicase)
MVDIETNLTALWVEVLVDCPGATGLYTYRMPKDLAVQPGDIVNVSFGAQQVGAIAIRLLINPPEGLDPSSIKTIESVINSAFFSQAYWTLLKRVARYYQTSFIKVIRTALPPGLLSRSQRRMQLTEVASIEKIKTLPINLKVAQAAAHLIETLAKSPQGDYSWQYVQRQLKSLGSQSFEVTQALRQLMALGMVTSYLAPPRSLRAQQRQAVILTQPLTAPAIDPDRQLSKRHQEILATLASKGGELWLSEAIQLLHTTRKTLKTIADQGYLVVEPREFLRASSHSTALSDQPKPLSADQAKALEILHQLRGYSEALLHGVTGSGKTEVYLQAIAPILAAQKSALVLVPEIGLTPQLTDRFRSRFGEKVCVYHSALSEGERYDTWRQMLTGTAQVIIGTRSAVFAPLPNLGMIILDEEHDSSFKQDQPMPCYHARQVAQWRAELENCPLILGSATPCTETWVRFRPLEQPEQPEQPGLPQSSAPAKHPKLYYLCLPQRIHARPLPPIEVIDMRSELHEGNRTIFSRSLQKALENLIETGNQGILFIHRRGHSSFVSCRSCGHVMGCPHCDVSLSFHQTHAEATAYLRCHYCGYGKRQPKECPQCCSPYLKNFGSGTQRVVNDLAKYLPQARCLRFDSDTTRNKGSHRALLTQFEQRKADLLVGTQMLTKGIDLPQVTLVGVIAADGLLFMPDYRASERAFQLMTQVAGRAGRGEQPGRVIVQTYSPEHVAIKALTQHAPRPQMAYGDFLKAELSDRAALGYPPYGRLILLRISGLVEKATEQAAQHIATQLHQQLELQFQPQSHQPLSSALHLPDTAGAPYSVMGPVPAPIFRVARRYRWHILIKLALETPLPKLSDLQRQTPTDISLSIDVDPLNLS